MKLQAIILSISIIMLAAVFTVGGCDMKTPQLTLGKPPVEAIDDESGINEKAQLAKDNKLLKREIEKLKGDNAILDSRVRELTARERKLTQKASELQLDNNQLKRQVEIYSSLPAERDRYKLKYQSAMKAVVKLKAELEALNGKPAGIVIEDDSDAQPEEEPAEQAPAETETPEPAPAASPAE